jgi:hypothetical protein
MEVNLFRTLNILKYKKEEGIQIRENMVKFSMNIVLVWHILEVSEFLYC